MAKVKFTRAVVAVVTLELTEEEAGVLRSVLRSVGGHVGGLRGLADRIEEALEEVGVTCIGTPTGAVRFDEGENDEN